jgi:hypothetical protein
LWVDDQRISVAGGYDCSVLSGDSVSWEAFSLPDGLLGWSSEDSEWIDSIGEWDLFRDDVIKPGELPKLVSEGVREWTDVGDKGS